MQMVREQEGKFSCTDCGYVYSSMLGDDEVPETCSQCDVYYDDGKPLYNPKPIDDDSIEPNKECSQCDVEYTCFDCEIDQIRTRYPDARYVDSDEWVVPINV